MDAVQTTTTRRVTRLWLEIAVLAALLASFLTIPLAVPHIAFGVVWATLAAVHVARRRRIYGAVLRRGLRRRAMATTVLISTALVVAVSGLVQWAGMAVAIPWHGGSSMLLLLLAGGHAARRLWTAGRPRQGRVPSTMSKSDGTRRIRPVTRGEAISFAQPPGHLTGTARSLD